MLGFQEKQRFRRILYSKVTLIILAVIVLLLLQSVWGVWGTARETRLLREREERTLEELKARAAILQAEVDRLSAERGIEGEIRSKFDVAKEGESVLIITDPKESGEDTDTSPRSGFWATIVNFFK